jgi:RNA polymerase sigma-70 factor (ECF subfamily)
VEKSGYGDDRSSQTRETLTYSDGGWALSSSAAARFPALPLSSQKAATDSVYAHTVASTQELSDESLIAQIRSGDQEALAILFRRYARLVWSVAEKILRDPAEAEDVMQELFLCIQRKAHIFDMSKGPARTLIVHMTYQHAISRRRYLNSRQFYGNCGLEGSVARIAAPRVDHYEDSFEAHMGRGVLQAVLADLSEDQRETLKLCFFEGYTLAEISERLSQPLGNVRHHYYRALEKLRKKMPKK